MCIVFNRSQKINEVTQSLDQLREYLDTLGKYEKYRDRIYLVGLIPNNKVINITNNRGSLFYGKDKKLTYRIDSIAKNIIDPNINCPTLANSNKEIISFLEKKSTLGFRKTYSRIASSLS